MTAPMSTETPMRAEASLEEDPGQQWMTQDDGNDDDN